MEENIGIYIHIPFCYKKCFYCDFCSFENKEKYIENYMDAILNEIINMSDILALKTIQTIYIGGGTPSYVDSKYIVKLLNTLKMFNVDKDAEITIEINPNSLTDEKLKDYILSGINRFSIGLQSVNNDTLKLIGRSHTFEDYIKCLQLMNKYNINNISTDLIYPLPNLDFNTFKSSIDELVLVSKKYPLKHISVYNLELHEGTKLDFLIKEKYLSLADEDEEYKMKKYLEKVLEKQGFFQYEISNFAKKGFESKHNLKYWKQEEYLGFGLGASSFISGCRYSNTKDLNTYISHFLLKDLNSVACIKEEQLDELSFMKEYIMLNLRLKDGVNKKAFFSKFKKDIFSIFNNEISSLINLGLIENTNCSIHLTPRGMEIANIVFQEFI